MRPSSDVPLSEEMAFSASSVVAISTKPKPLERPVSRSVITAADITSPKRAKAPRRPSLEVENERPPTNSFTDMTLAPFVSRVEIPHEYIPGYVHCSVLARTMPPRNPDLHARCPGRCPCADGRWPADCVRERRTTSYSRPSTPGSTRRRSSCCCAISRDDDARAHESHGGSLRAVHRQQSAGARRDGASVRSRSHRVDASRALALSGQA